MFYIKNLQCVGQEIAKCILKRVLHHFAYFTILVFRQVHIISARQRGLTNALFYEADFIICSTQLHQNE